MKTGRREFVSGGGLALAGVAAGTIAGLNPSPASADDENPSNRRIAGFGWELANLDNNGADVYFEVISNMILNSASIDVAFVITATPSNPGFAEVLCRAAFSRGAPKFVHGDPGAPFVSPASSDFGTLQTYNPRKLNLGADGYFLQNVFYNVILKTWVPDNGVASATSRHVSSTPLLPLTAGDYLTFHMNHAGVPGDCEMQVVLEYTLT
jgi:hypothetical protein